MVTMLKFKAIRSQVPKCVKDKHMEKVQRLDGCGMKRLVISNDCLRYSPRQMPGTHLDIRLSENNIPKTRGRTNKCN